MRFTPQSDTDARGSLHRGLPLRHVVANLVGCAALVVVGATARARAQDTPAPEGTVAAPAAASTPGAAASTSTPTDVLPIADPEARDGSAPSSTSPANPNTTASSEAASPAPSTSAGPAATTDPVAARAPAAPVRSTVVAPAGGIDSGVVVGVLVGVILGAGLGITIGVLASESERAGPATPGTLGVVVALEGRL